MLNRRGLLKLLGIGTAVAPIVKGEPLIQEAAILVEPAKVELVDPAAAVLRPENGLAYLTMTFEGVTYQMRVRLYEVNMEGESEPVDVTSHHHSDGYRHFRPGQSRYLLSLKGEVVPTVNLHIGPADVHKHNAFVAKSVR